ncbi:MAG: HAD family hydrolase [Chloroflexi bacterium]|nr:MAG: HAD family hydrolase [Chloroflexota bacterium]TME03925.1 MAG: HAD family hydrolase [Chloroflexota bacterium]TME41057.1 MAG: HAD family hydrolase [Chloroflexota bacterium]TME52124.1 MAG: HAD family hydrolase [Chloroflexota bacterium]
MSVSSQAFDTFRITATAILIFGTLIRAIVFDFDGLILDTEEPIYRSWLEVYEAHGEDLPFERWVQIVGSTTIGFHPQHHLEERLGRPLPKEVLDRRLDRRTEMILAQRVLPGVVQRLDEARELGLKLGVASSSTGEWVRGHLARLGILERFDCLRCRDDVTNAKPEPDLYIAVLDCLGVAAAEAFAIEDSPHGVAAAKRAGMRCVAIPNSITARLDLSQADLILTSLAEFSLTQLLERLTATP